MSDNSSDFLTCPKNVLDVEPRRRCQVMGKLCLTYILPGWMWYLAIFIFLQVAVVLLQQRLGPAFFLPKRVGCLPHHTNVFAEFCSSLTCKCMTIIHSYHSLLLTQKRPTNLSGTVLFAWRLSILMMRSSCSRLLVDCCARSEQGEAIVWHLVSIYLWVLIMNICKDALTLFEQHTECLEKVTSILVVKSGC